VGAFWLLFRRIYFQVRVFGRNRVRQGGFRVGNGGGVRRYLSDLIFRYKPAAGGSCVNHVGRRDFVFLILQKNDIFCFNFLKLSIDRL
jgi:hypothetical protein